MKSKDERYPDYPLFKGLQRPLEFLGIQGRYIYWAAVTTCGAIVGFVAAYCLLGFIAGLVVLAAVVSVGIVLILLKQRKGLHSKKVAPGCVCVCPLAQDLTKEKPSRQCAWLY